MSVINSNPFGSDLAAPGLSEFDLGGPQTSASFNRQAPADTLRYAPVAPIAPPLDFPGTGSSCTPPGAAGGGFGSGASFSSILNQISAAISGLFAQLGSALGNAGQVSSPANAATTETPFANATAGSVGDPHLTFDGTSGNGAAVAGHWDSMQSHGDLLDSDSFAGGYRVSTQVTNANAKGVTLNASASVTTGSGATSVSMQADGSYAVASGGTNVVLERGQATSLGNGETVTLNEDGSLNVSDTNASGGTIETTLKSNHDGGVDVSVQAHAVDLGGYLVTRSYVPAQAPVAQTYPPVSLSQYQTPLSVTQTPVPVDFGQYDPESGETSLESILA